jgi:hypothetical protein
MLSPRRSFQNSSHWPLSRPDAQPRQNSNAQDKIRTCHMAYLGCVVGCERCRRSIARVALQRNRTFQDKVGAFTWSVRRPCAARTWRMTPSAASAARPAAQKMPVGRSPIISRYSFSAWTRSGWRSATSTLAPKDNGTPATIYSVRNEPAEYYGFSTPCFFRNSARSALKSFGLSSIRQWPAPFIL